MSFVTVVTVVETGSSLNCIMVIIIKCYITKIAYESLSQLKKLKSSKTFSFKLLSYKLQLVIEVLCRTFMHKKVLQKNIVQSFVLNF